MRASLCGSSDDCAFVLPGYHDVMSTALISIRTASPEDAEGIALVHEDAWGHAYQGIIPHLELSRMIARRGPGWWQSALLKGTHGLVLDFDGATAGYVTYGRSRLRNTPYSGELFELYVKPDCQGVGFGSRLFEAARLDLKRRGLDGLCVWCLCDNERACQFYSQLGGRPVSEGLESFGDTYLRKIAFAWA